VSEDHSWVSIALQVAHLVLTIFVGIYAWVSNGHRANRAELAKLREEHGERLRDLGTTIAQIEERQRHAPTVEQFTDLLGEMRELCGEVRGLREQLVALTARTERHDEFLHRRHG
jgi:hypothetical protein